MLETMEFLENAGSWEERCELFGEFLGLEGPSPPSVLRRALVDKKFNYYLVACRTQPKLLRVLLDDQGNNEYERPGDSVAQSGREPVKVFERSNVAIASQAAGALWRWGKAGFAHVDSATFERRFAACEACPHLVEPPERLLYKLTLTKKSDPRICNACGCVASRKAHLPSESCPVADPNDGSLTRWGEPRMRDET